MLVNLTPSNKFRSHMSRHKRNLRHWGYTKQEVRELGFKRIFTPTEYTGVYVTDVQDYAINNWCKQTPANRSLHRKLRKMKEQGATSKEMADFRHNAWDFGVADNIEQVIDYYTNRDPEVYRGNHVVFIRPVKKNPNAPCCDWRWHKWGQYIGTQEPQCEYLNDEPDIDAVVCFSIYKVV